MSATLESTLATQIIPGDPKNIGELFKGIIDRLDILHHPEDLKSGEAKFLAKTMSGLEPVLGKEHLAQRKRPKDEEEVFIEVPCTMNGQIASAGWSASSVAWITGNVSHTIGQSQVLRPRPTNFTTRRGSIATDDRPIRRTIQHRRL